jgi:hypothetical protein
LQSELAIHPRGEKKDYGIHGMNGTNGKAENPFVLPFVPLFPFVPYSLFLLA